jgi:hypothetical protein
MRKGTEYPAAIAAPLMPGLEDHERAECLPTGVGHHPAAYNSAAYAEALRALGDGAVRDVRIVEGLE